MTTTLFQTGAELFEYLENFPFSGDSSSQQSLFQEEVAIETPPTRIEHVTIDGANYPKFINQFWTSRQRQACSLHEVSYRACFKPQLPRFFITLLTRPGDVVYDPFSGRGTTALEAGLLGRSVIANDVNPLSKILAVPRFFVPDLAELKKRLSQIPIGKSAEAGIDLSMFYHPHTEAEIVSLKNYLQEKKESGAEDALDGWIRMVATNRLTGHSPGFFSVYTLPPNQAVSRKRQKMLNERRKQRPPYRSTRELILKKSKQLISGVNDRQVAELNRIAQKALFLTNDARKTPEITENSVQLTVTSPPFLNVVQYAADNWLRCWFNNIDAEAVTKRITMTPTVDSWTAVMAGVFRELYRITRPGGWTAFEVGEVQNGKVNLDEHVAPLGVEAGFECVTILINQQQFTKTANIWGVHNNRRGTNTNRIVVFRKTLEGIK